MSLIQFHIFIHNAVFLPITDWFLSEDLHVSISAGRRSLWEDQSIHDMSLAPPLSRQALSLL